VYTCETSGKSAKRNVIMNADKEKWDLVVKPQSSWFDLNLKELWAYRDLLMLFVKRDIVSVYKQTVLGPVWFILQPILMSLTFTVVFGNVAQLSTDGQPKFLFYLSGITCWNYFAECINNTSNTFVTNAAVFGKVYFPRLISPLSVIVSSLLKFLIQLVLFIGVYTYYYFETDSLHLNLQILWLPYLVFLMGMMGLGMGIIISSFTTKYRDLRFLIAFGVQLMMYITPVILPLSEFKGVMHKIASLNPMTPVLEAFKSGFFEAESFNTYGILYASLFSFIMISAAIVIFNKVEKDFMDTI
jgi:lipopolysaccharide transport system permease protein